VTAKAIHYAEPALSRARTLTPVMPPVPPGAIAQLRHAVAIAGDGFLAVGIVFCIPFVILAIGIPIALGVQVLLWMGRLLESAI
jgi:hypothetical protein